jgi:hypothetical protein
MAMRIWLTVAIVALLMVLACPNSMRGQSTTVGNGTSTELLPQGAPDLSGVWYPITDKDGGFWASYVVGDKFGLKGTEVPMTPAGKAVYAKNIPGEGYRYAVKGINDPVTFLCLPAGVPRVYMEPNLIEFIQQPDRVIEMFELDRTYKIIYMDGRKHPEGDSLNPSWWGDSIGHYEGDTLVIDTVGFNDGKIWLDRSGHPISEQGHIVERIKRIDKNTIADDFTIEDPKFYTQPWQPVHKLMSLHPEWEIREDICQEGFGDYQKYLDGLTKNLTITAPLGMEKKPPVKKPAQ